MPSARKLAAHAAIRRAPRVADAARSASSAALAERESRTRAPPRCTRCRAAPPPSLNHAAKSLFRNGSRMPKSPPPRGARARARRVTAHGERSAAVR